MPQKISRQAVRSWLGMAKNTGTLSWKILGQRSNAFAFEATFSGVKPNSLKRSLAGADSPNVVIPSTSPSSVTYLCQPSGEPASTASLFFMDLGNTCSLYASLCCSNSSQDG